jgi:hypothetical protein
MKIWHGYGSEHSASTVMIGHFKSQDDAKSALKEIELLQMKAGKDQASGKIDPFGGLNDRYPDGLLEAAEKLHIWDLSLVDYSSFTFEFHTKQVDKRIEFYTDESEIIGYVKFLVGRGAKVEVYSTHDYPESGARDENTEE